MSSLNDSHYHEANVMSIRYPMEYGKDYAKTAFVLHFSVAGVMTLLIIAAAIIVACFCWRRRLRELRQSSGT